MKNFAIIVALDEEQGIGKAGDLAWHIPSDLKHFKAISSQVDDPTKRNAVIMGRKTWESLPEKVRPLPGRLNIILSSQVDFILPPDVLLFPELDQALANVGQREDIEKVYVIGGAQLYSKAIFHPNCAQLFVTQVKGHCRCDVFFPIIPSSFKPSEIGPWLSEQGYTFRFVTYLKSSL